MLTAFDVAVGVLVLISAILATARGLTREVLSLATWAGSAAIAVYMYFFHADIAQQYIAEEIVANIATVLVSFIVSLIVLHLLTMRIADFVVDSRIGPIDRTLGFVFGVLRGVLIAVVVTIFGLWLMPNNLPEWASNAQSLPYLRNMGNTLVSMLPEGMEEWATDILRGGSTNLTEDPQAPATPLEGGEADPSIDGTVDPTDPVVDPAA